MTTKEAKKEISKTDFKKVRIFFIKVFSIGKKTWFFTIIFFTITFVFSFWTWWQCVLNPSPSEDVILEIQKERTEFEMKSKRVDLIIEKIRERKTRFEGASDHQLDKKIFKSKEDVFNEMELSASFSNSSDVNRMP